MDIELACDAVSIDSIYRSCLPSTGRSLECAHYLAATNLTATSYSYNSAASLAASRKKGNRTRFAQEASTIKILTQNAYDNL